MKFWMAWLVLVGSLVSGVAEAAPLDGNNLLKACRLVVKAEDGEEIRLNQQLDLGFCLGFIQGVRSMNTVYSDEQTSIYRICFPYEGITNGQAARIIVNYLNKHPELLNEDPIMLTLWAFRGVYPCK